MHKHVYGLDLIRAAAITLVVYQHGALFFFLCYGAPVIWTKVGTIGVTLFFALSGFLIGGIMLDLGESLSDRQVAVRFWMRRALRTLPNYYLFVLINVGYWSIFQRPRGYPSPFPLLPRYVFFLQNFAHGKTWFLSESWSLSVEEWFYLLFPLGLFAGLRLFRMPFIRIFWVLTVTMIVIPVLLRAVTLTQEDWALGITKVVIYRPDSIAMGLAAVGLSRRFPEAWPHLRIPGAIGGLAILAASLVYVGLGDPDHSALARVFLPLIQPVGSVLLLPWASNCTHIGGRLFAVPIRRIAQWSYSLYLVNLMLSSTVLSHMQFHYGTAVGIISYVAACLASSAAIYYGFEAPILRWRDRHVYLADSGERVPPAVTLSPGARAAL
jgi:peptidoglycan/LPS O-acetylase OafA/YrhL